MVHEYSHTCGKWEDASIDIGRDTVIWWVNTYRSGDIEDNWTCEDRKDHSMLYPGINEPYDDHEYIDEIHEPDQWFIFFTSLTITMYGLIILCMIGLCVLVSFVFNCLVIKYGIKNYGNRRYNEIELGKTVTD